MLNDPQAENSREEKLRKAIEFVEKAKIQQIEPIEEQCIDGRTDSLDLLNNLQQKEVLLRPAGAAGISLLLLAAGYSPEVAYRSVFTFLQMEKHMRYGWHTDDHSKHDNVADSVVGTGTTHRSISLKGEHGEQFVLINKSQGWSILPGIDGLSAFVYDKVSDEALLAEFVEWFNHSGFVGEQPLNLSVLKQIRDQQDTATLRLLAFNKDVFSVDFDDEGSPQVQYEYTVQAYTKEEISEIQSNRLVGITGCGHLQGAINYSKAYGVTQDKVIALYRLIQQESMASDNWEESKEN